MNFSVTTGFVLIIEEAIQKSIHILINKVKGDVFHPFYHIFGNYSNNVVLKHIDFSTLGVTVILSTIR